MYATVAPIMAAEAAKAYESGGPEAFARFSRSNDHNNQRQLVLLDGSYQDVESRPVSEDGLRAAHAAEEGQLLVLRGRIAAYKFVSSSGHPYILMLFLKSNLRQIGEILWGGGFVFSISLMLLVTLLCLGLAYHIASPIHSIQSTARRVAQGDLKARVPTSVSRRFDELAALAKDFDSMVSRLDSLIETQKKLLNSVSHELRSPLARINISLALLRNRSSADSDDLFQRLDRDVVRIDLLMGQLLTLSRLESGFSSGERENLNFAQLVEEVAADATSKRKRWVNPSVFRQTIRFFSGMPILTPSEALARTLFAMQCASHRREAMCKSFWTSIGAPPNRWQFFLYGIMALEFRKIPSRRYFSPSIE